MSDNPSTTIQVKEAEPVKEIHNAVGSTDALLDLADAAGQIGDRFTESALLNKAIEADNIKAPVGIYLPQLGAGGFQPINLDDAIIKSMASSQLKGDPTPFKYSESLHYLGAYTGIREPSEVTRTTLMFQRKVGETPALSPIISNLTKRSHPYCKTPKHANDTGFAIRMKNRRAQATTQDRKTIDELTDLIKHGGYLHNPDHTIRTHPETGEPGVFDGRGMEKAMGFRDFVATAVKDSITMDWFCFRMEPDASRKHRYPIVFFSPVDSAQIRRTVWNKYTPALLTGQRVEFVEVAPGYSGQVIREYTWETMGVMIRNPRVDFFGKGYGFSEVEASIDVVTSFLMGLKFQREFFDSNHIPPGIVNVVGEIEGENSYAVLKQQLAGMGGINAFWKLLYLFQNPKPGVENNVNFIPMRSATGATGEMEYALHYQTYLMNLICAIVGIDPEEIGFESYSGQGNSLNDGNPQAKIENSRDRCFVPLMESIATAINENIIRRVNPEFEFEWVNLITDSQQADDQHVTSLMARGKTPNDIADELDEPRLKRPVDPALYAEVKDRFDEDDEDTPHEFIEKVEKAYEQACKEKNYPFVWSSAWDAPVGNALMMQVWQMEQQALQAAVQQQQQMEQQMQQMGIDPKDPQAQQKFAEMQQQMAQQQQEQGGQDAEGAPAGPQGQPAPDQAMQSSPEEQTPPEASEGQEDGNEDEEYSFDSPPPAKGEADQGEEENDTDDRSDGDDTGEAEEAEPGESDDEEDSSENQGSEDESGAENSAADQSDEDQSEHPSLRELAAEKEDDDEDDDDQKRIRKQRLARRLERASRLKKEA